MATLDFTPQILNIQTTRGDMLYLMWDKILLDDSLYGWTGSRILAQFKTSQTASTSVFTLDTDNATIIKDGTTIEWLYRTTAMESIPNGNYFYDMQEFFAGGDVITHVAGVLNIDPDVTRGQNAIINVNGFGKFPIIFT